jgi:Ca2+-dependent lipid-binding protein
MSGKDLKNLDTVGKSDPYARVNLSGIQKRRTPTWKNNLNPDWDEVFYVPLHSAREKLTLEVMDEENVGSDRSMGKVDLAASDYVEQGEDGEYLVHDTKHEVLAHQLRIGNGSPKGTLYFTAAFYPTIPTVDPEEEDEEEEAKAKASMDGVPKIVEPNGQVGRERSNTAGTVSTIATTASKAGEREMQRVLSAGEKEQVEAEEVQTKVVPKIRVTAEDLTKYGMCQTTNRSELR